MSTQNDSGTTAMDCESLTGKAVQPLYRMTVYLSVLDHLGLNLHSNMAAALTEVVANARDADAEVVTIAVDPGSEWIEIADNGIAMSVADTNDKYLRVGYRRRDEDLAHGQRTSKGRSVMGRRGLESSPCSRSPTSLRSSRQRTGKHGLLMSVAAIREAARGKLSYHPSPLPPEKLTVIGGAQEVHSAYIENARVLDKLEAIANGI